MRRWSSEISQGILSRKALILMQIRQLNVDASHIDAKALAINLTCIIGGGQLSTSAALMETQSSLDTKIHVDAEKIATESLNKFLVLPENYLSGEIEHLALTGAGVIDQDRKSTRLNSS